MPEITASNLGEAVRVIECCIPEYGKGSCCKEMEGRICTLTRSFPEDIRVSYAGAEWSVSKVVLASIEKRAVCPMCGK